MRLAAKRDKNEREIIEALQAAGCTVQPISAGDVPDLIVGYHHPHTGEPSNILMEVKSKGGKLRPGQEDWIAHWKGAVVVVWTIEEALQAIGRM